MQRRDFLTIAAAGVTATSFNLPTIGQANTSKIYKLRAGEANANLIGDGTSSEIVEKATKGDVETNDVVLPSYVAYSRRVLIKALTSLGRQEPP